MSAPLVLQEGPIIAWFKHCRTGEVTQKELRYEIQWVEREINPGKWIVFQLFGGPTGYESFVLVDEDGSFRHEAEWPSEYWSACAGTVTRWDECRVHKNEMTRVLSEFFNNNFPYIHEDVDGEPICPNRNR